MVKGASIGKELIVKTSNQVGILANISKIIAEHGINIEAMAGWVDPQDKIAHINLVTEDNRRVKDSLARKGFGSVVENEVVLVDVENKAGAVKVMAEKLAENNIDINYSYATNCGSGCPTRIVLATNDNEKAVGLFSK